MNHFRAFAIVPAAGVSQRMGQPKLLLEWRGRSLIEHVLAAWTASAVTRTVVVVRPGDEPLAERCRRFDVDLVVPEQAPREMRASVEAALHHLQRKYRLVPHDAWLLAPADLPGLAAAVTDQIVAAYDPRSPRIVVPTCGGRRGHPVLFPWSFAAKVRSLPRGQGVNVLLEGNPVLEVPCDAPGILEDLDTLAIYRRLAGRPP